MAFAKFSPVFSLGVYLTFLVLPCQVKAVESLRVWVSQEGTTVKATLLDVAGTHVKMQTESGATISVALTRLSAADRAYVADWASVNKPEVELAVSAPSMPESKPAGDAIQKPTASTGPLVWPTVVEVDAKTLEIQPGEQDAGARKYVYRSGSFQFTSQAPLTDSVMREVARDFELTNTLFKALPWGWESKPLKNAEFYFAELYETEQDYIKAGGDDNSSGYSKPNLILTKFDTLGLKKVGGKYARDAKANKDGAIVSLVTRLVMADMRNTCLPWATMGLEGLLEYAAYRNGTFDFSRPERGVKERVALVTSDDDIKTDVKRMVEFLHLPWAEYRSEVVDIRRECYLDGLLLVYFFGYLDGDGKGTRLHEYFRAIAQEAMGWRKYNETKNPADRPGPGGTYAEMAQKHLPIVIVGRSDEQLQREIVEKFRGIGLKL